MSEAKKTDPPRGDRPTRDRPGRDRLRRDADGLVVPGDLVGAALAGLVGGAAVLLVFEVLMSLATLSTFGSASGWLILILPAWLFVDEFRAASFGAGRVVAALLAASIGLAAGLIVAGQAAVGFAFGLPLVSGAIGAVVCTVLYALVWYYGLRWLRHRVG